MSLNSMQRMNLAGLEPVLQDRIRQLAALTVRTFDGAPEHVAEFTEALDLLEALEELESE